MKPADAISSRIDAWPAPRIAALLARCDTEAVERALAREDRSLEDLAALLSPAARPYLEPMAQQAQHLTRRHFGRTILLYAPVYLSNVCQANCAYCNFSHGAHDGQRRVTLDETDLRTECKALAARGFNTVLLLTGEAPDIATAGYIARSVAVAREYFPSVSVEVYALDQEGYQRLYDNGLEGVTLYMETYDRRAYAALHRAGVKRDYDHRLQALDRAGAAGVRRLNVGALLGLFDWRVDGFHMALHADHLRHAWWRSTAAVSFPRLRHVPNGFAVPAPVADADLVQLMLALRLFLPESPFALSTRETPQLRNHLIRLGITSMSAGSSTRPGGYASPEKQTPEQFAIEDNRSCEEVVGAIVNAGYDPVWKDYDRVF